jgi:hypothetical protein
LAKYADIAIKTPVSELLNLARRAFDMTGFQVTMVSATAGRAEKGSTGVNVMLGALATHHVVDFEIFPSADGGVLRLVKTGSGASGGLLGMRKANKEFEKLTDTLVSWFTQQGVFVYLKRA